MGIKEGESAGQSLEWHPRDPITYPMHPATTNAIYTDDLADGKWMMLLTNFAAATRLYLMARLGKLGQFVGSR